MSASGHVWPWPRLIPTPATVDPGHATTLLKDRIQQLRE
jgi:hypothetical protein